MRRALLLLALTLLGCSGMARPAAAPDQAIAISTFENTTFEPLLEHRVTEILKETFLRRGWKVTGDRSRAAMTLTGRVHSFDRTPISLSLNAQAQEYRIRIGLEYAVVRADGEPLRQKEAADASAEYISRPDPLADRAAEDRAIREAGKRLAERIADRVTVVEISGAATAGSTEP